MKKADPVVNFEACDPENVVYKRGSCCVNLTGFCAELFRQMIWLYGESGAADRFWSLWYKKAAIAPKQTAASPERA